jgi:hypothetical protein
MKQCLLNLILLFVLTPLLRAQTDNITGVTVNLEGTVMYYTVERGGQYALYKATRNDDGTWNAGVSQDSFNGYIEGYELRTPFLAYDGQTLYFSANLPGSAGFDIFYSRKDGNSWSKPAPMSPVINSEQDELSPSLSADNLTIYFTRNSVDNECFNIYVSEVDISGWSVPQLLPTPISMGCEKYVHISPAGETLLFSTDRLSEKKRKRYNVFSSTLISRNIWTAPLPITDTPKEYNEYTPAIDYANSKIIVTRSEPDSLTAHILSYDAAVSKPYTIVKGVVRDEQGNPLRAEITVRNAYTFELRGKVESDPLTGQYFVVLPNNGLYNVSYAVKNGSQRFENINTVNNIQGQTLVRDFTLIGTMVVSLNVQDAISDDFIDAEIKAYEKTKTAKVARLDKGKYRIQIPVLESADIELYKENYVKENIYIKFGDYIEFPEMYFAVKMKPDMRSGIVNVRHISSNRGVNADIDVRNLNIEDESVVIAVKDTGKYEFSIRKDCRYSISVTLKDHFYYYTVWKADVGRVGQTLDVRLVPLAEISKIPMPNFLFVDGAALSPEAEGELTCIVKVLKNNPEYIATISLYHLNNEQETTIAQQQARAVTTFMELQRISHDKYRIEILPVDDPKIPDINFVLNTPDKR